MARTTHHDRAEIQRSDLPKRELARQLGVSRGTIDKWKSRDTVQDRSHRTHTRRTTLTPAQEEVVIALRTMLLLPLDDLLAVTKEFINPEVSRSGLQRCLDHYNMPNLRTLKEQALAQSEAPSKAKTFKDYEPGFLHIDIKYLPKMPDEADRRYLFVAIDRATRWVFIKIYADQTQESSVDFLGQLQLHCPVHIKMILTDNGTQFTDRFTSKDKEPSAWIDGLSLLLVNSYVFRFATCLDPFDNIPSRSWLLFQARSVMKDLISEWDARMKCPFTVAKHPLIKGV